MSKEKKKIISRKRLGAKIPKYREKARRLLKRSGRELRKNFPDLDKVQKLQQKAATFLQKAITKLKSHEPESDHELSGNDDVDLERPRELDSLRYPYTLEKVSERYVKKFQVNSCAYRAKVSLQEGTSIRMRDVMDSLGNLFSDVITDVSRECKLDNPSRDKMRVLVTSNHFHKPLSTRLVTLNEQSPALILSEISKVLQSDEEISLDSSFGVDVIAVKSPAGSGYFKVLNYAKHTKVKRCIIKIKNLSDDLCCARALVTGREIALKGPRIEQLKKGRPVQKRLAIELHRKAGVNLGRCDLSDIDKFQDAMPLCQIIVYSFDSNNSIIYEGPQREKKVILYHHEGHFDVINPKMVPAVFGKRFYCKKCKKYYNDYTAHPCNQVCKVCCRKSCMKEGQMIECPDCHKICRSDSCFSYHKKGQTKNGKKYKSKCEKTFRCTNCSTIVDSVRKSRHVCGERRCWICKDIVEPNHLCYLQSEKPHSPSENLLFFDFETDQSSGEHVPNYCIAQDFDGKEFTFKGSDALDKFCTFLFDESHKDYTAIAHNAKAFDSLFLMQWLFKKMPTADIRVIRCGQKIMQLQLRDYRIRVIDSLNFFHMRLAALPKAFGLSTSLMKGTFPHLFNRKEHWSYVGPLPDLGFYDPDSMNPEQRTEFLAWHASMRRENYVFDFQEEIRNYCSNDVTILRESCLRFREIFIEQTNVDPLQYVTIASAVMAVFRSKFLVPNTIAIVPKDMYRGIQKLHSQSAIQWLEFVSYVTNKNIQHADNKGEYRIYDRELDRTYFVDGYCTDTKEVFEFYGCIWHGCNRCTDSESQNVVRNNVRNGEIYEDTLRREKRLRELGYKVNFMWECDFKILSQTNEFKTFINTHEIPGPLNPRDAFFGGRTNATKLFYSCKPGEKILYVDFCSLYPYINKVKEYPILHPKRVLDNFGELNQYFGLIKCKILPPSSLYFPVLPVKIRNKLFFPLCKQCAIEGTDICSHSVSERSFWGTWTTCEVSKAVDLGYRIIETKEIWHFDKSSSDLFKGYVNTFLKLKQQSSGFPAWVQSDTDKERYAREYLEHEGIHLNLGDVEKNPPLRQISKLALNSLWGKFGMITDRAESEFVSEPKRFFELCNTSEYTIEDLYVISEDMIEVVHKKRKEYVKENKVTNIFIAVYTTACARLELYNILERLGPRVLYFDTDSLIYLSRNNPEDYEPKLSDYLGGLTDEIAKDHGAGHYIKQFVSTGPKSYSYAVTDGSCKVKIKGFSLNYKNSQSLNMESMKEMVKKLEEEESHHRK